MCFSATASFVAAGVIGTIGVVCVSRAQSPRDLPLAATPLLFAAQQAVEGFLWLDLSDARAAGPSSGLVLAFLLFARVFWPAFAPMAVMLVEPNSARRRLMRPWLGVGLAVAAYLLWELMVQAPNAVVAHGHILYGPRGQAPVLAVGSAYLAAVVLPLLLSSQRPILILGLVILAGCVAAYLAYYEAFQSVWCYFAAAASVTILAYFEAARRRARAAAAHA